MSPLAVGLINMELNRGDGSLGTFLGCRPAWRCSPSPMLGSEEQKQRWLPGMARMDTLGAFALTEPRPRLGLRRAWRPPPAATATAG